MAKISTAIRFEAEERDWIQSYADLHGMSFSDVVREATLEHIEDALDLQAYNDALAEDDGQRLAMEEVMKMAMISE